MVKKSLLAIVQFLSIQLCSQPAAWYWGRSHASQANVMSSDLAALQSGGAAVLCASQSFSIPGFFFDSELRKYQSSGTPVWSKTLTFGARWLGSDLLGNLYLAGNFKDTLITATNTIIAAGGPYPFVVKLDPMGHEIWSRAFTGCATATLAGMVVDGQGRVTIGGGFTTDQACDSMIFGQHVVKAQLLQTRMFVTRLDALGTVIWARTGSQNTGGGKMYDRRAVKLALDDAGDTYVLTESVGCNASCFTRFVVSFDVNGTLMMDQEVKDPVISIQQFGVLPGGDIVFVMHGSNIELRRYNQALHLKWSAGVASLPGNPYYHLANDLAIGTDTSIYLAGQFVCSGSGGGFGIGNLAVPCYSAGEIVVARYLPTGALDELYAAGSHHPDNNASVDVNGLGEVYMAGTTRAFSQDAIEFGDDSLLLGTQPDFHHYVARIKKGYSVGVAETGAPGEIEVYPNPTENFLNISTARAGSVEIYSTNGACVRRVQTAGGLMKVDVASLNKGLYLVLIREGSLLRTGRFLRQ